MKILKEIADTLPQPKGVVTVDNFFVGARVMRGPDWSYQDVYGHKDAIGVITKEHAITGAVYVEWPNHLLCPLHIGYGGKHDIIFAP